MDPEKRKKLIMVREIIELEDADQKKKVARIILEGLSEWFEIEESREAYISQSGSQTMFAAFKEDRPIGFLCLTPTSDATLEIVVMGVDQKEQGNGIGRKLVECAKAWGHDNGYAFLQVKTVAEGHYPQYDATNRFYQKVGFQKLEIFLNLWDENNPCQVYITVI